MYPPADAAHNRLGRIHGSTNTDSTGAAEEGVHLRRIKLGRSRRTGPDGEKGAELVEFALVISGLVLFLYGIIGYGFFFGVKGSMNQASNDGSRAGLAAYNSGLTTSLVEQDATNAVQSDVGWLGTCVTTPSSTHPLGCTAVVATCSNNVSNQCLTVTVDYNSGNLLPLPFYTSPSAFTSTSTVQLPTT
jgi:Flp pilus assembly protein TadG